VTVVVAVTVAVAVTAFGSAFSAELPQAVRSTPANRDPVTAMASWTCGLRRSVFPRSVTTQSGVSGDGGGGAVLLGSAKEVVANGCPLYSDVLAR